MAPSKIRQALGAVKDQTSIGLAKVNSTSSLPDLDVAIVKATRHDEYPAEEKYIREIITLTSYSRAYISSCVNSLSKRLGKTKNWTVALKTLMLIHRLLIDGDTAYEKEILFATRHGTRLLNMSDFRDTSCSDSWDYSAFIRTYALYLDERLEFSMRVRRSNAKHSNKINDDDEQDKPEKPVRATPVREMRIDHIFIRTQHLQRLLERFLACRPTGAAKNDRVVMIALYPVVKESFQIYYDITEIMGIMIDRFMELPVSDCVKVYEIFARLGRQFDELDMFYKWCNTVGIARSSDYPEVERITSKRIEIMNEFIREKSALAQIKKDTRMELKNDIIQEEKCSEVVEEDMNAIKALPPPEGYSEVEKENEEMKQEVSEEKREENTQKEADLLDLSDDAVLTSEEQGDRLALALFDGGAASASASTTTSAWKAFAVDSADWETALVQAASNLSNQRAALGGGFDTLLLDGMYQQSAAAAAGTMVATGSASSVALGSAGKPAMLALPAPPVSGGATVAGGDPFAASISVAPPLYVQMSEMEKKQKLLVEEQLMWQQYAKDGMPGHLRNTQLQTNPYTMGGYTKSH